MKGIHAHFLTGKFAGPRPTECHAQKCVVMFFYLLSFNWPFIIGATQQDSLSVVSDGSTLNISLLDYDVNTFAGQVIDNSIILLPSTTVTIDIIQIPRSVEFLLFQAHSFYYNVTLSYKNVLSQNAYTTGTNIGLVQLIANQNTAQFFLFNEDQNINVSVLLAVQGYGKDAPIPGGCNMEFPVETAPYLEVGYNDSVVWVDIPPPGAPAASLRPCELQQTELELYHMYLPERDFSSETYFQALRNMMTVQDIQSNGRVVESSLEGPRMRRLFSSYPGTGSVYGVIAIAGFSGAAYVPAITYSCSVVYGIDSCDVLTTSFSKVLCAVTLFLGLFVCFLGHRFLKTEMFLLGFLVGGLVSYILIGQQQSLDIDETVVLSLLAGLLVGTVWLVFWCVCGIPVLSVLPATLTLGYIVAAITMYAGVGDYQVFESDFNYWMLFICVALTVPILMVSDSRKANILCCGVLGAYAVIVPIDHYIGSNLKFILLNTIRRATEKRYKTAVIDPPFQTRDMILCAVWFGLASLGITYQWYQERGKPPFPAPQVLAYQASRRRLPRASPSDRTPLITDPRLLYGSISTDDNNVFLPTTEDRRFTILPKFPPSAPVYAAREDL